MKQTLEHLYAERRKLIAKRKEIIPQIEELEPPEGCMWTSLAKETARIMLSSEHFHLIQKLDENKILIQAVMMNMFEGD